ncbi:MAG: electron transfer flavoprotein subunit beta/FixA family protein [Pseudomonadota bacterium]
MSPHIIVCAKQILDPEGPVSGYGVNSDTGQIVLPKGVPPVINPYDENAIETALKLKDTKQAKVTVISLGKNLSRAVMSKALAVGADNLIFLQDNTFVNLDSRSTAFVISAGIKKIGDYDLVLAGRQAGDTDSAIVPHYIAGFLNIPCINLVKKAELLEKAVRVERSLPDGYEVLEANMPSLLSITGGGDLRKANLQQITDAKKKPVTIWTADDLDIETSDIKQTSWQKIFVPDYEVECNFIKADSPKEAGTKLALKLKEDQIL